MCDNKNPQIQAGRRIVSETMLIALGPIFGYLNAFYYVYGKVKYYDMPLELVKIDNILVIEMTLFSILLVLLVFAITNIFSSGGICLSEPFASYLLRWLLVFDLTYLGTSLVYFAQILPAAKASLILVLIFLCIDIIALSLHGRGINGINSKFEHFLSVKPKTLVDHSLSRLGTFGVIIVTFFCLSLSLCYLMGKSEAENKLFYNVLKGKPEQVVIEIFDDRLVTMLLDKKTNKLVKSFSVISYGANPSVELDLQKIGPLKL